VDLDEREFTEELLEMAEGRRMALTQAQAELCFEHARLMIEWNERVNLTRITKVRDVVVKHVLDSMIPGSWLPREGLALDVGTGPGFPGVPLKVLSPGLDMVLVDSNRKKVSFLKHLIAQLGLSGLRAVQSRWEDLAVALGGGSLASFHLIVIRAVRLDEGVLTELAPKWLQDGGVLAWWAGPEAGPAEAAAIDDEMLRRAGMLFDGARSYSLPGADAPRQVMLWRKEG
jgi:16S rRNA (guanine527-N7)-methyltransferase